MARPLQGWLAARHTQGAWKQARKPRSCRLEDMDHLFWGRALQTSSGGAKARPHLHLGWRAHQTATFVGVDALLTSPKHARRARVWSSRPPMPLGAIMTKCWCRPAAWIPFCEGRGVEASMSDIAVRATLIDRQRRRRRCPSIVSSTSKARLISTTATWRVFDAAAPLAALDTARE